MGKNSEFPHVPGIQMARGDRKVVQVRHLYAEK